jgi:tetratricopeptide (TPR) repeat protein
MIYSSRHLAKLLSICLLLILAVNPLACAPKGKLYRIKPVSWEGVQDIAVRGFYGHYGEIVRNHIYQRLGEVQYFYPTDAVQLCPLGDLSCDTLEEVEFLQLIEGLKADAVITGNATAEIHDTHGFDRVQVKEGTGYYKKAKNASGKWVDVEIERTLVRTLPYVVRKAYLSAEYKVFDLKAKGVIDFGEFTEIYEEKFGGDKEYDGLGRKLTDLPASSGTLDELSATAARKMVARLSRMRLAATVKLDRGGNRMVKRGAALAKRSDWERAVRIWEQVIREKPDNSAAYYNLGVAQEGLGDLEGFMVARDLYRRASAYGEKKLYADGIKRVDDALHGH